MRDAPEIDVELYKARVSEALDKRAPAAMAGRKTWLKCMAAAIETDWRTIESWLTGATSPHGSDLLKLCRHLGPEFTNDVLDLAGQLAAWQHNAAAIKDANKLARAGICMKQIKGVIDDYEKAHGSQLGAVE